MPGFGESAPLPADVPATAANLAARAAETLRSLGIERAHVAGISLGAWAALEFAKTDAALSATTLCAAGFWRRVLGPRPETARAAARRAAPAAAARCWPPTAGRRAVLSGPMAHPERVPAGDAYALVRAYATAPGFSARQPRHAQRPVPRASTTIRRAGHDGLGRPRPVGLPARRGPGRRGGSPPARLRPRAHLGLSRAGGGHHHATARRAIAPAPKVRAWPTPSRRLTTRRSPMPAGTSSRSWRARAGRGPRTSWRRPPAWPRTSPSATAARSAALDAAGLAAAMRELEDIFDRVGRAGSYASLAFAVDTQDAAHRRAAPAGQRAQRLDRDLAAVLRPGVERAARRARRGAAGRATSCPSAATTCARCAATATTSSPSPRSGSSPRPRSPAARAFGAAVHRADLGHLRRAARARRARAADGGAVADAEPRPRAARRGRRGRHRRAAARPAHPRLHLQHAAPGQVHQGPPALLPPLAGGAQPRPTRPATSRSQR